MGLFSRSTDATIRAGYGAQAPTLGGGTTSALEASFVGATRERAMSLPTISRGRDLICSLVSSLPIRQYGTAWNGEMLEEIPLPPEPWMLRPDSRTTRTHSISWLVDDLLFHGKGYWYVSKRYAANGDRPVGFPAEFVQLPASMVSMVASSFHGNVPLGDYSLTYNGQPVPNRDVIVFYSPMAPLLAIGGRAIRTAERLDTAAWRFSSTTVAAGWLEQTEGDMLDDEYLDDAANRWQELRDLNAIAALGRGWKWNESSMDPSKLQLTEARQHQALELARLVNVSPFLVGAPTGSGMTYQNAEQARQQLAQDALPFIETIEQTLSSDAVTPRGRVIKLDRSAWSSEMLDRESAQQAAQETPA